MCWKVELEFLELVKACHQCFFWFDLFFNQFISFGLTSFLINL